ncbi:MAG: hypothetical protein E8D40_06435 [Nitrospira sp.]|nr:MAG: hypothetical protein E8D40_06435 [Nitrospira sp.]
MDARGGTDRMDGDVGCGRRHAGSEWRMRRLGLQVVVDRSKGGPTIYHEEGLDISGQVIEEFNREYP